MSNTDNFIKASANGQTPVVATLTNTHTQGSEAFECDNLTGWADTAAFIVYETDSNGNPIPGSETSWVAEKNNKILQNAVLTSGTDRDYPVNKTMVVADYTAEAHNRLVIALLKTHNQDGTLKEIDGSKIKDSSLDGSKLKPSAVKPEHLSSSILTISGSSEYTTDNNSTVKLDTISSKVGDLLSLSGNSIVVGAGVSKILVSANIFIKTTTPAGYAWGTLNKNNTSLGLHTIASVFGNFCSISISPVLLDVSQGDKITAEFFDAPGGGVVKIRGAHSWLTAQVVA